MVFTALVGAFSVIVQPVVEPMDSFTALTVTHPLTRASRLQWSRQQAAASAQLSRAIMLR